MDDWGETQLHCTNDMLLVCVAGEAWESYKKLNCVRCHGEPPQSLVDIANSKRPMIPWSLIVQMQSIQSRDVASVFILGKD